ncbi:MAG TPA: 30S ribosomal protein S2 [archaeon]|nr:30S ribosomal protein S2 [archaeon]
MPIRFLISRQQYLASGLYIGTKQKTKDMKDFIFEVRPDGVALFNLKKTDERIRMSVKMLLNSKNILVATRKRIGFDALQAFGKITGSRVITGRFIPGMLTNPKYEKFYEADLVFVVDPITDYRVVEEAIKAQIPIMAVCNSFDETKNIDYIIPANNSSRKSIATLFWVLAREIAKAKGEIKNDREFKPKVGDFEGAGGSEEYNEQYEESEEDNENN